MRPKLKATLVQHFGGPCLDQPVQTTLRGVDDRPSDTCERLTAPDVGPDRVSDHGDGLPVEGDVVGGCYRLVCRLGEGMFGRVYVAERTDVQEHRVALKVMTRAVYAGRNVERELVMLAAATHPNIVQLKDHGMTDDYVWLTMPLYDGETLAERLERGPLGLREAYELFLPIARGVQALNARGLRHQDIKPENVFLATFPGDSASFHPVLLDLGVAVESNATFVAGTALYCAPEQIVALGGLTGRATLTEKMDTYCLASTLLRALVGEEHFPGEDATTPFDIACAFGEREEMPLREAAIPTLTGEPRAKLAAALSRWLTRLQAQRPTAREMAEELDVLLEQEREAARAIEDGLERQKTAYRRIRFAFAGMAIMGASAGLYIYSKRETLRLAAELEKARAEGAASFDKLDTCIAAHRVADDKAQACATDRAAEEDRFMSSLTALVAGCQQEQTRVERELEESTVRLRTCEADERALESEKETWTDERTDLIARKTNADNARRECAAGLAKSTRSQTELREDLNACVTDRDICFSNLPDEPDPLAAPVPALPTPIEADPANPPPPPPIPEAAPTPEKTG